MSGPIEIVLILAVIGYVLVRRMIGEAAQAKRMLILPAILAIIGLTQAGPVLHSPVALLFLLVSGALSVVIGALRGASVRISNRNGLAFVQYTWVTVALWVANIAVKFGGNVVFGQIDPHAAGLGNSLFLTLGLGMLIEGLVVTARALRGDTQVIWAKGENGAPHTGSPLLENMRHNINGRAAANRFGWDAQQDRRY